jgi:hypothetical protein
MPFTVNKGLSVPTAGSLSGTWGTGDPESLNEGVIEPLDEILGGVQSTSLSSSNVTLTAAQGRKLVQRLSGTLTANVTITNPNIGFNIYENATTGAFTVTVQYTGAVGGTVTLPQGSGAGILLVADGINGVRRAGASALAAGTTMLFVQTSAPAGWTKVTTHNDKALRVVSGAASSGGSTAFSTVFASRTTTIGDTTLTVNQIPAHSHVLSGTRVAEDNNNTAGSTFPLREGGGASQGAFSTSDEIEETGGGQSHTHSFTAMDFAVQYVDVIIATLG